MAECISMWILEPLPFASSVTIGELLSFSVPQFLSSPICKMDLGIVSASKVVVKMKELIHAEQVACLQRIMCSPRKKKALCCFWPLVGIVGQVFSCQTGFAGSVHSVIPTTTADPDPPPH